MLYINTSRSCEHISAPAVPQVECLKNVGHDEEHPWLKDATWLYYDPIWTTMQIGRTKDGAKFIHVNDGMCLVLATCDMEAQEMEPVSLPEWVYEFDYYPGVFMERAVCNFGAVIVYDGISISEGLDRAGRRWVYVELDKDKHLLLREPNPHEHDEDVEDEIEKILAHEADPEANPLD